MPCAVPGRLSWAGAPAGPRKHREQHREQRWALPSSDATKMSSLKCPCRSVATSRCQVTSCCCSLSPETSLPGGPLAEQIPVFDDFAPGVRAARIKAEPHLISWLCSCLLPAWESRLRGVLSGSPAPCVTSAFEVLVLGEGAPGQVSGCGSEGPVQRGLRLPGGWWSVL